MTHPAPDMRVDRSTRAARTGLWAMLAVTVLLALAPWYADAGAINRLTALCIYVLLAAMWNALAGYGGLVSIGQQMFFGLGAYATIRLSEAGVDPFVAVALAGLAVALLSWPVSLVMLRLRGG